MLASLIGGNDPAGVARYRLLLGTLPALPGIPMLYMGDEIGLPNDGGAGCASEARWLHRPMMDWHRAAQAETHADMTDMFLGTTVQMIALRRHAAALGAEARCAIHGGDAGTLRIERGQSDDALLIVARFGGAVVPFTPPSGWHGRLHERLAHMAARTTLESRDILWLARGTVPSF